MPRRFVDVDRQNNDIHGCHVILGCPGEPKYCPLSNHADVAKEFD